MKNEYDNTKPVGITPARLVCSNEMTEPKKWWTESLGRIEFQMTLEQAEMVPLMGQADNLVKALSEIKEVTDQLDKYTPELIAECLSEYGAWDDEQLKDHEQNIQRLLYIAACDIQEQDDNEVICAGCQKTVPENGYCDKDGSVYGDCCWTEHAETCESCKDDIENA
jgi:hypothetical protein